MQLPIYIKKLNLTIPVDTVHLVNGDTSLAAELDKALECKPFNYALRYGLTQSVNDAHADIQDHEKALAASQKKLAAILAGTVKVRGAARTHADPIMHEAMKLARAWWKGKGDSGQNAAIGKLRAKGGRFDDMEDTAIVDVILARFCAAEDTQNKAKAIVAANSIQVEEDFDLDEIMPDDESDESNDNE